MTDPININSQSFGTLPEDVLNEIWSKTLESSAAMRLARRINLPGNGAVVPIITGEPSANWTGETEKAQKSDHTGTLKTITPYTLTVIECFSNKFKRDLPGLYAELATRLPYAIGRKFDEAVFGGSVPGSGFDTLADVTAIGLNGNTYGALVDADTDVAIAGYMGNGYALSPQAKGVLLRAVDSDGRPLFINNVSEGAIPQILGNRAEIARGVYVAPVDADAEHEIEAAPGKLGWFGDWNQAVYGLVHGLEIEMDKSATIDNINLFQQGMFALKVTAEVGFAVADKDAFICLTDEETVDPS